MDKTGFAKICEDFAVEKSIEFTDEQKSDLEKLSGTVGIGLSGDMERANARMTVATYLVGYATGYATGYEAGGSNVVDRMRRVNSKLRKQ